MPQLTIPPLPFGASPHACLRTMPKGSTYEGGQGLHVFGSAPPAPPDPPVPPVPPDPPVPPLPPAPPLPPPLQTLAVQVCGVVQVPQSRVAPQPSLMLPQFLPWAAQVVGTQSCPQTLGVPLPPQVSGEAQL